MDGGGGWQDNSGGAAPDASGGGGGWQDNSGGAAPDAGGGGWQDNSGGAAPAPDAGAGGWQDNSAGAAPAPDAGGGGGGWQDNSGGAAPDAAATNGSWNDSGNSGNSGSWNDNGGGGWKDKEGGGGWKDNSGSGGGGSWNDSGNDGGKGGGKDGKDGKGKGDKGKKGGKAEDWTCPGCGANVFAKKDNCFKCGASKDGSKSGDGGAGSEICRFFAKAGWCKSGDSCPYKHTKEGGGGDWECPKCGDKQFARNERCRKCGGPRPGAVFSEKESEEAAMLEKYINASKLFQRQGEAAKETWWWWCDVNGYKGKYDPRRKEFEFLKDFVESQKIPFELDGPIADDSSMQGLKGGGMPPMTMPMMPGLMGAPPMMPGGMTMPTMPPGMTMPNFPMPGMPMPGMPGMPPGGAGASALAFQMLAQMGLTGQPPPQAMQQ